MHFGGVNSIILICLLTLIFLPACAQKISQKEKTITQEEKAQLADETENKAIDLRLSGDVQAAIKEQLKAIALDEQNASLWVNLTAFYLDAAELEKAKETGEKAVKLNPNNAWAHYTLGEAYERLGDEKIALTNYQRAVALKPEDSGFIVTLARIQSLLDEYDKARENFQKALKIKPNFVQGLYHWGNTERYAGNLKRAAELYEQATKTTWDDPRDEDLLNFQGRS